MGRRKISIEDAAKEFFDGVVKPMMDRSEDSLTLLLKFAEYLKQNEGEG